jgi:hypothetical protein
MQMRNRVFAGVAVAAAVVLAAGLLRPEVAGATDQVRALSYGAKLICSDAVDTDINIYNPHFARVTIRAKSVAARELGAPDGAGVKWLNEQSLGPDGALRIGCEDLGFEEFDGFLVIYSQKQLDVVGHYESTEGDDGNAEALDIEEVTPKTIDVSAYVQ